MKKMLAPKTTSSLNSNVPSAIIALKIILHNQANKTD